MVFTVGALLVGALSAILLYRRAARTLPFGQVIAEAEPELQIGRAHV